MKVSVMNGQDNTSQLSHHSFPDTVLLLDIVLMTEQRKSLYFHHRLDVFELDQKKKLLNEHTMLRNKAKNLGLDPKSQLPLKSKVAGHRWIINADKSNHVYIVLVSSSAPESFIKRLQRRLQGKVAQISQKYENFTDLWVQEKFGELLDSFNDAIKKQHLSDYLSSSEFEGSVVVVDRAKVDVEQQLELASQVSEKTEGKFRSFKPILNVGTLKIAVIVMIGLFLILCLLHRFTAPQHVYQLKHKVYRKI